MRSRILLQWFAGTLGGFLGWVLTEPIPFLNPDVGPGEAVPAMLWSRVILFGVISGAAISACIAAAYGAGSGARVRRSALIGAVAGIMGGGLGLAVGQFIYQTIQVPAQMTATGAISPVGMVGLIVARGLGWAAVGAGMGLLQGAINWSSQRSRNGLIGGAIGGLIGGVIFELLGLTVIVTSQNGRSPFFFLNGALLRAVSLTVTGSAIGLFVGLTERAFRNAWVRVRVGRNEGTEFMLEKGSNTVGRDELSDIPLFGDVSVQRHHADIKRAGGAWIVEALAPGVALNGQPIQVAPLSEGDLVTVATREIEFHQKGAPRAVPTRDAARPAAAPIPVPEGVCPYCGDRYDAQGRCSCTPVSTAPSPGMAAPSALASEPVAGTAGLRLVGLSGVAAGQVIPLDRPEVTLGREPDRDIILVDGAVSRRHARILSSPSGPEIVDEGSSNGTFVNGARVGRSALHRGDEVRLGGSAFRVEAA